MNSNIIGKHIIKKGVHEFHSPTRYHIFPSHQAYNSTLCLVILFATSTTHGDNLEMISREGHFITYLSTGRDYYYTPTSTWALHWATSSPLRGIIGYVLSLSSPFLLKNPNKPSIHLEPLYFFDSRP